MWEIDPIDRDDVASRFTSKLAMTDTCWLWTAALGRTGYARFWLGVKTHYAHRISWLLFRGSIPEGMLVCHTCDVRHCVNPDHLFLGTHKDNAQDAIQKGRKVISRGNKHGSRTMPWRVARGERHSSKTKPHRVCRGERHGNSKLTDDAVIEIRAERATGTPKVVLAERFQVSVNTIEYVEGYKTWKTRTDGTPF